MRAMIFAAGLGTRLKPLTDTMPKALVSLAGKPLLQWQVEKLRDAGIDEIVVNVHHFADMIIDAVAKNNGWGTHITISDERDQLLDTGGGLRKAIGDFRSQEAILLCNVDILSNIDVRKLKVESLKFKGESRVVVSDRETQRYLCFDEEGYLCGWTNVKTGEIKGKDGRHLAYSGMAVLTPEIGPVLEQVAREKGEVFSMIDVYLAAMQKCKIKAYIPTTYRMMDVGKIDQITEAEAFAKSLC